MENLGVINKETVLPHSYHQLFGVDPDKEKDP